MNFAAFTISISPASKGSTRTRSDKEDIESRAVTHSRKQ